MTSAAQEHESKAYPPSPEFTATANAGPELQAAADADRLGFWDEQAKRLDWAEPWTEVLDWSNAPFAKWFVGGKLNVAYNCVDRHVEAGNGDRVAIHFEGEPGDSRSLTYNDLLAEVSRAANTFTELGLVAGDRVAIYMPMIPEAIVTMLACARLGLTHSVVFGGLSSSALRSRIDDAQAKLLVTVDGQWRRGQAAPLKNAADEAVADAKSIEHVLVVARTGIDVEWTEGRDLWWHETVEKASPEHEAQPFDSEHPLFILYTSGTTGKPKGIIHSSGGYLTQASYTHHYVFDHKPGKDVYWCTADIGWVTGHSYIVYGPLSNGVTQVVYEGTPITATKPGSAMAPLPGISAKIVDDEATPLGAGGNGYLVLDQLAERAPALRDHREVRGVDLLHRPDADPHVHEVGSRDPRRPRPVVDPSARQRRRADQPGGVALVPRGHRRGFGPDRRHLVADRDRRDHDLAAARHHRHQARLGDGAAARYLGEDRRRRGHPARRGR